MVNDLVIIGGGIVGVSTAYALARSGVRAMLIESGDLCTGSSYGNAGLICPCHSTPIPGPGILWQGIRWMANPESPFYIRPRLDPDLIAWLWEFRRYCNRRAVDSTVPALRDMQRTSLGLYELWLSEIDSETAYEKRGALELFLTHKKYEAAAREVEHLQGFGLQMDLLGRDAVRALEPAVTPDVVGGVHYREDAHIDPDRFVRGLAAEASRLGAEIRLNEPVLALEQTNGRIATIRTSKRTLQADQIVLAAGAWTPQLLKPVGIRLPMQPAKGYSITMEAPEDGPHIPLHLAEARMAVTPIGGLLRFAGTLELSGLDPSIDSRRVNAIRRGGLRYLELETSPQELEVWAGFRPVAPDGLPYIGRHPAADNLILATGHAMLGVSMGPVTGQIVSEIAAGQRPSLDIAPYHPARFERDH